MNWRSAKETPEADRQVVIRETGARTIWGTWVIKKGQGWFNSAKYEWLYASEIMDALSHLGWCPNR